MVESTYVVVLKKEKNKENEINFTKNCVKKGLF